MTTNTPHIDQPTAASTFLAGDAAASTEPVTAELAAIARATARQEWRAAAKERREADQLLLDHQPLVVSVALGFARGNPDRLQDLIQAGNVGLLLARQTWDPARSTFGNAARFCVVHQIDQFIRLDNPAVVPHTVVDDIRLIERNTKFYLTTGRTTPTADQHAADLDIAVHRVRLIMSRPAFTSTADLENLAVARSGNTTVELAELRELKRVLPTAIAELSPRAQELIAAMDLGLDVTTAAQETEMSRSSARTHLTRAQRSLRGNPLLDGYLPLEDPEAEAA